MKKGILISFDGIDSSGKETQAEELARRLRNSGHIVHTFQTPDYTTKSGQELKRLLRNEGSIWEKRSWQDKMKLFAANRVEHRNEVLAALSRGELVVYDRYVPSSLAFITVEALLYDTSTKREKIQATVTRHEYTENDMPREDISVVLEVPPKIAETMLEQRKHERKESSAYTDHLAVQQKLYNEYKTLCAKNPQHYLRIKCFENGKLLGREETAGLIWRALIAKFPFLEGRNVK